MARQMPIFRSIPHEACSAALCFAAIFWVGPAGAAQKVAVEDPPFSTDHILVRVRAGCAAVQSPDGQWSFRTAAAAPDAPLGLVMQAMGVSKIDQIPREQPENAELARALGLDRWYRVTIAPGSNALGVADLLRATWDGFEVAEVDGTGGLADIPNDTSFTTQYSLLNTGQSAGTVGADIRATNAWTITSSNPSLIIGVLDSGISPHSELTGRILPGVNIPLGTTDATDVCGGHGTHVAGILAARGDNGSGIAGLCWDAKLLPVVIVNPCSGLESYVADGLVWAVDQGADVINMSLQYSVGSTYLHTAVQYATAHGVPMIAAAGNNNTAVAFPARWSETIAVAASNRFDARWVNSNFGLEIDVAAPGESIYSLALSGLYGTRTGTSMATPHVAGTVALMLSRYPTMSAEFIRSTLMETARDINATGFDVYTGAGVINAGAAVAFADAADPGPADMNGDGRIDGIDLTTFLTQWGNCTDCECTADFDADCVVGGIDLSVLLSNWSPQ
ncbi:MAG: hypothetical protein EXS15_05600 [Phycisphaerales bacterium]|nr:hypothetical protein [Phycisphaerales bacterium]